MEVSTPQVRPYGRRSFINPVVCSPLRKSLGRPGSASAILKPLDDEHERSTRRSIVEIQRKLHNITGPAQSPLVDSISLDENQVQAHLQICVKLFTENRISAKNAWQLQVIDAMRKITSIGTPNVLQVAGSSLDIGAKVYGLRVDDIHAKGLQLASSISKNKEQEGAQDNDEDNGLDTSNHQQKRKKRLKKLVSDNKNIIDVEGKTLFGLIELAEAAVFSTKENIDISATDNLFTQKSCTNPSNHQLMSSSSKDKYWLFNQDEVLDSCEEQINIQMPQTTHHNICGPFTEFETGTWDPEEEERLLAPVPAAVLDDNGLPIAELDGSINDIFQDDNIADDPPSDCEEQEEFQAQIHGEIGHIVDAIPEHCRIETDYGYNVLIRTISGKYIDKIWAGPSHWKVKFNRRSASRYSGSTVPHTVKHTRKTKIPEPLDFSQIDENLLNGQGKHSVKRAPPTTTTEKISLPVPELELSMDFFQKFTDDLLMKPGVRRPRVNNNIATQRDYEVQPDNFDNPNEYCSRHSDIGDHADLGGNSFEEDMPAAAQEQFLEDNLLDASELPRSNQITYALQAKKMDMKKLKTSIWHCLGQESEHQKINLQPTPFSTLYGDLPPLLPSEMRKELTCPLAMVALLHLCNEHTLILQKQISGDFIVMSAD